MWDGQLACAHIIWFCGVCVCVCVCVRACVCVRVYSRKQWLLPIQPEVMRQSKTPAGCNEAPCSSTLPHQVSLCLSAQQACVCTAPRLATKPHMHKHTHTHTRTISPYISLKCLLYFSFFFPPPSLMLSLRLPSVLLSASALSSSSLLPSILSPSSCSSLLSARVLCNWAVVNSTLAWISSVATSGWRCWPPPNTGQIRS